MLPVHEGQFIGLAIAIIGGGGMALWYYIEGLKEEAARSHERAARAEEEIAELKDRINRVGTIEISNW